MNVLWRFLWLLLFSRFSSKLSLFDECTTSFRVLPTDIDVLMHMNNGRYFSLMDLARIDFMIRNGAFSLLKKQGVYPVIASEMIRFKRSLQLFQKFEVSTRLIGWDDKFFYVVHHFKVGKKLYALSLIKSCFLRQPKSLISPEDILTMLDIQHPAMPLPAWVKNWQQADQSFHDEAKNTVQD